MKHLLKLLGMMLALAVVIGVFASCNRVNGLTPESEAIGSPETVARNKEPYSTTFVPFDTAEQAIGADYALSPYYQSLNGEWDFTCVLNPGLVPQDFSSDRLVYEVQDYAPVRKSDSEDVAWGKITVPSNWEMQGYDTPAYTYNSYPWDASLVAPSIPENYNPVGIYRKNVTVPADWSGRQVYVTMEGVASCVYVYVNGALVGYAEDSYTGKTFNLTEAIRFGSENLIVFEVYKYCDASYLEANDSIKFGGIYRDVYLYSAPDVQVRDLTCDMQTSGEDALVNLTVTLAGYNKNPGNNYSVFVSVYDSDGKTVLSPVQVGLNASFPDTISTAANAYVCDVGGRVTVPSPTFWSAENPVLYTVVLELKDGDDTVDVVSKRMGFKTVGVVVEVSGNQTFVVNDKPVTLRGILYNENSPVNGMAITKEEMIADIQQMKALNVNAVRSPGRPLSETFIRLCDEYGLYVVDDMSLNSNPYSEEDEASIPGDQSVWQTACLDRLLNVVYRDKNSASVIMWCIGNNSGTGSNFSVLRTWLSSADNRMILYDDDASASDLVVAEDLSLNNFVQLLSDSSNRKAVLVQDTTGGLLNNGGNFTAYSDLMNEYDNFQGGFFGYWADNAVYWPVNTSSANEIMQTSPYSEETASSYRLTYAGGWGDTTSTENTYKSLSGVVSADRKTMSDANELKNALSPIYISAVDARSGQFRAANRTSFTDFAGNYEISYEVMEGAEVVASGTVSGLTLTAGTSETFTVDYGTVPENASYYIYFTVKSLHQPTWANGEDASVFARQFSVNETNSVPKDGTIRTHEGGALALSIFQAPQMYINGYALGSGKIYVTNRSLTNFNDVYTLSWVIYEQNAYWETKRWVVYDEGTLANFNVPAGAVNQEVTLPLKTNGAAAGALYAGYLTVTLKTDVGDVPAGTQFVYEVNTNLSGNIMFRTNPLRDPQTVYANEDDTEGKLVPAEVDAEPEVNEETDLFELPDRPASYDGNSFLRFDNDKLRLTIDASTGLISEYTVDGKTVLVGGSAAETAGMISSLLRTPTGGDLTSSAFSASSLAALRNLTQNYADTKILPNGYRVTKVSDRQYRITLDYVWVSYPVSSYRTFANDNYYTVVYDVYSDGELQVSVKYDPSVTAVAPTELSSILTLPTEFTSMSWYGMGEGESYSDKFGSSRMGVYKNKNIEDEISSDYLYGTDNGDKTKVRWISFERADGSGIVITGDSNLLTVNVGKEYPWSTSVYPVDRESLSYLPTVVRVIGQQRGISANTLFDQEYSAANYMEPGVAYTYSFRVVPVSSGFDADAISRTVLNSGTVLSAEKSPAISGAAVALSNAAAPNRYLSVNDGGVAIAAALGSDSQYWILENATDVTVADAIRLKNLAVGQYLSPTANDEYGRPVASAEMTLAPYKGFAWQNWIYENNSLRSVNYAASRGYALTLVPSNGGTYGNALRISLLPALGQDDSKWTFVADDTDPSRIRIMSSLTGKYLSVVDSMTYSDPLVADYYYRLRNYSPAANWGDITTFTSNKLYSAGNYPNTNWTGSTYYVTQWNLLPANSQLWTFHAVSGGYVIVNRSTGNALTLENGALAERAVTNAANQIWSVVNCNGMYGLVNPETGLALTLRSVNGEQVLTAYEWKGLAIQKWNLATGNDLKINIEAGTNW